EPFERRVEHDPLVPTVWAQRVMGETATPAPALALATRSTLEANPLLRDAAGSSPFLADPMRARSLGESPRDLIAAVPDSTRLGTNGADLFVFDGSDFSEPEGEPDSTAYGSIRVDFRNYEFSDAFESAQ